ncbi:MAG: hypothetical protein U1D67_09055, partial [Dehalococcoidia bacterium]|nr:hypothetical protein [Dehalococcoidia bacterium]
HVMRDLGLPLPSLGISLERRFDLDAKMMYLANAKGYDSIALMTTNGYNIYMKAGRIPRQIELQVFSPRFGTVKPIVKEHWITASWR